MVLVALLLAAGILLGMERPVPAGGGPFVLLCIIAGLGAMVSGVLVPRTHRLVIAALLFGAGFLLGGAARSAGERACPARLPPDVALRVAGTVESVSGQRLRLRLTSVSLGEARASCNDVVPARWRGEPPRAGLRVRAVGRWWTPGGPRGLRVVGALMLDSLTVADGAAGRGTITDRLAAVRGAAARRLEQLYGERAPLAVSLLLAQRDGVDREVRDRFARSGLSHLLAISGLHVGLVAGLLLLAGRVVRLSRGRAAVVAGLGTTAYVLFLGAPASASRAALQVVLLLIAATIQRPARSEAVVATAAVVLLALRPAALMEPGFQLSFAGVAGILALRRPLLRRLAVMTAWRPRRLEVGKWLADGLATGIAATVATAPIVAWHFGQVAPVGVVANLAAVPLVGALVPVLALSLAMGSVWMAGGEFLAGTGGLLLGALETLATVSADLPGAGMAVSRGAAVTLTLAALLGVLATRRLGRVRPRIRATVAVGVGSAALIIAPVRPGVDRVELHMIDVGQGDAIAIRSPAGRWLLVDAGIGGDRFDAGERRVVPYLSRRGVRRLDGLILTHPDADHFGGGGAVVTALRPRWIADPGLAAAKAGYLALLEQAVDAGSPWVAVRGGVELELDGMLVEFLHPVAAPAVADANDASVVLRLSYGEFSALLTGDAPAEVEHELIGRAALEADVLKVGHHGSVTSTSPALLDATDARVALISAGRGNRYGHPHPAVLARLDSAGIRTLRTDRHGSVVVWGRSNGELTIRSEREDG